MQTSIQGVALGDNVHNKRICTAQQHEQCTAMYNPMPGTSQHNNVRIIRPCIMSPCLDVNPAGPWGGLREEVFVRLVSQNTFQAKFSL